MFREKGMRAKGGKVVEGRELGEETHKKASGPRLKNPPPQRRLRRTPSSGRKKGILRENMRFTGFCSNTEDRPLSGPSPTGK